VIRSAALVVLLACAGCGSAGPMLVGSDGGDDAALGDGGAPDLACLPGASSAMVACGSSSCSTGGQVCCYASSTGGGSCSSCCASGSSGVQCTSPNDCGGKPCCLELVQSQPTIAYCVATQDACPSGLSVGSLAGLTGRTRMCNIDADCTVGAVDSPLKSCCTSHYFGMTQKICFTKSSTAPGITCP